MVGIGLGLGWLGLRKRQTLAFDRSRYVWFGLLWFCLASVLRDHVFRVCSFTDSGDGHGSEKQIALFMVHSVARGE